MLGHSPHRQMLLPTAELQPLACTTLLPAKVFPKVSRTQCINFCKYKTHLLTSEISWEGCGNLCNTASLHEAAEGLPQWLGTPGSHKQVCRARDSWTSCPASSRTAPTGRASRGKCGAARSGLPSRRAWRSGRPTPTTAPAGSLCRP